MLIALIVLLGVIDALSTEYTLSPEELLLLGTFACGLLAVTIRGGPK